MFRQLILIAALASSLSGCAASKPGEIYDPLEPVNRKVFWFNDKVDTYFLAPVARGYKFVLPGVVRSKVTNFFDNLAYPVYLAGDLLQLKLGQAGTHTGRFLINTTLGVGGLFEVAEEFGLEPHEEDIGIAFGYWGVPDGPYIVIPFLGPSNLRDLVGSSAEIWIDWSGILMWSTDMRSGVRDKIVVPGTVLEVVNMRANLLEAIDTMKEASVDYYSAVRSSYAQRRKALIEDLDQQPLEFDDEEFGDFEDFEEE